MNCGGVETRSRKFIMTCWKKRQQKQGMDRWGEGKLWGFQTQQTLPPASQWPFPVPPSSKDSTTPSIHSSLTQLMGLRAKLTPTQLQGGHDRLKGSLLTLARDWSRNKQVTYSWTCERPMRWDMLKTFGTVPLPTTGGLLEAIFSTFCWLWSKEHALQIAAGRQPMSRRGNCPEGSHCGQKGWEMGRIQRAEGVLRCCTEQSRSDSVISASACLSCLASGSVCYLHLWVHPVILSCWAWAWRNLCWS